MRRLVLSAVSLALVAVTANARADGLAVSLDQVAPGSIKVNGVLSEWSTAMTPLNQRIQGGPSGKNDLEVRAALAYDDAALYVAADVIDDKLVRTASYGVNEDRMTLVLVFPQEGGGAGFSVIEVDLFPGDPGNVAGAVAFRGAKVSGTSLVEAPNANKTGYTFEARIPWSVFPPAAKIRVGLRGVLRYHDSDGGPVKTVMGTSTESSPPKMPRLPIDAERGMDEVFAREKGLSGAPQHELIADVTGDGMMERVVQWDQFVLVAGPTFRAGKEFFFTDLGVDKTMIPAFDVKDVTGDGKAELLIRKRKGSGARWRETQEVQQLGEGGLTPIFQHETGISTDAGAIANSVAIDAGAKQIVIALAASSATPATFKEVPEGGEMGALLPWGTVKSQTFRFEGGRFTKVKEESKPAGDTGAPAKPAEPQGPPPPPAPRPPTADEMQDQILSLYKKDRKVDAKAKPRFDLATNVAEDGRNERLLVFGKDLVVFGKGFLGGQAYVAVGLGFADARDVSDVTTRDLDGDGRAEILVRGVQHMKAPKELGTGTLDREVLLVYSVKDGKLTRVFAVETGLVLADKRLTGTLGFVRGDKGGLDLVAGPGHAVGWDPKSYPYKQDTSAVGGIEPMILPWTEGTVRYRWSGNGFARLTARGPGGGRRSLDRIRHGPAWAGRDLRRWARRYLARAAGPPRLASILGEVGPAATHGGGQPMFPTTRARLRPRPTPAGPLKRIFISLAW